MGLVPIIRKIKRVSLKGALTYVLSEQKALILLLQM